MRIGAIALFSLLAIACGSSYPPPNDEWSAAQQDVGKAEAGGAPDVPDAKLHLQLALSLAKQQKAEAAAQTVQTQLQSVKGGK